MRVVRGEGTPVVKPTKADETRHVLSVAQRPSCGAIGTLRHEPARHWRLESAASVGGGWYVQCQSVEDWGSMRAPRERPVVRGGG